LTPVSNTTYAVIHLSILSPRVVGAGGGVQADPGEFDIFREARVKFPSPDNH